MGRAPLSRAAGAAAAATLLSAAFSLAAGCGGRGQEPKDLKSAQQSFTKHPKVEDLPPDVRKRMPLPQSAGGAGAPSPGAPAK